MKRSYFKATAPILPVLVIAILLFGACDPSSGSQTAIIPEEETIAVINNKKITLARFQSRLHSFLQHYRELIATDERELGDIKSIVINQLIDEELISQEASRKGVHVTQEELDSIIAESLSSYEQSNFESYLKNSNLSEEEWKAKLRQYLIEKKLVNEEVIGKIPITKREITSYYQKQRSKFIRPQAIKVRNITLSTEEEAQAILSQLKRGKNFLELIRQHSISPDKALDGDLGYIKRGDLPEEMESEIFGKKFSRFRQRYTDVIRSQDGFHVLKLERYRRSRRISLEAARPQIKQILIEQKWSDYYAQWIERLRKNATITVDEKMLQREEGF